MAATETRPIVISNNAGDSSTAGTLYVKRFETADRVRRAFAILGVMWLLAVLTLVIPLVHFVVPPALLIAGPVLAWRRYRVTEASERVTGTCPSCGREFSLELDTADRLPMSTYCSPSDDPIRLLEIADGVAVRG